MKPFNTFVSAFLTLLLTGSTIAPSFSIVRLTDYNINQAIRYGLENKEMGLSTFLGENWQEGSDGALLNIYTPYMLIARFALYRNKTLKTNPNEQDIATARKKIRSDIDYIWQHPSIKFSVSLYGDTSGFAKNYYAQIEGTGKGRSRTLYPTKSLPQYLAQKEKDVTDKPFTAINSYYFNFDDIAGLEQFTVRLYGNGVNPIVFQVRTADIQ